LIEFRAGLLNASKELKGDREVVLEAVKRDGCALQYASEELKGDREVVKEAVKQNEGALEHASEELKGDRDVMLEAVRTAFIMQSKAARNVR